MNTENPFVEHTLPNGLRIVIEPMPHVQSVASGFLVQTGSRDESPDLAGVSHFVEHMCFKGTHHRTWRDITRDFDNMGSTYNAYTSKERTFYFGWVRPEDAEKQLELLADMMRSVFPPDEFETEKKVILEEIAMSEDQIEDRVYDLIHEKAYAGHPLGWPVLGTAQSIAAMTRDQLYAYFESRYHPANMILLVAGAVDPKDAIAMAERICGDWTPKSPRPRRAEPPAWTEQTTTAQVDRFQQQALLVAFAAPSAAHDDRETADVLASILGGHNSRFFWNIVQAGIAPHVAAGRLDYCDAGMMIAFGFCEPRNVEQLYEAVKAEIARISSQGVNDDEVQRVKNRTRTGLATEAESPYYRLMQLGGDVDVLGRPRTVAERLAAVERVTADRIRQYMQTWPLDKNGYFASLGPRAWP
ncbi:MAG TPA: pitrilysin family protein [Phycisphaerae bacterium]|nr:pitrilysin family protein [Phycisphaerae bacterium]